MGTSITCSATAGTKIAKETSPLPLAVSTTCSTGRSRICTEGQMEPRSSKTCCSQASLPASNLRQRCWPAPLERESSGNLARIVRLVQLPVPGPGGCLPCFRRTPLAVPHLAEGVVSHCSQGPLPPSAAHVATMSAGRRSLRRFAAPSPST